MQIQKTRSAEPIDQILIDKSSGWAVLLYFWAIYLACALLSKFVWHFIDLIVAIWLAIIASLTAISGGRKTELRHKSIMTGHRRECIYNGDEGLSILAMDVYKFARIQTLKMSLCFNILILNYIHKVLIGSPRNPKNRARDS